MEVIVFYQQYFNDESNEQAGSHSVQTGSMQQSLPLNSQQKFPCSSPMARP